MSVYYRFITQLRLKSISAFFILLLINSLTPIMSAQAAIITSQSNSNTNSIKPDSLSNANVNERSSIAVYDRQERILGQHWLRNFRGQVRTSPDPLFFSYIEYLIQRLVKTNSNNFDDLSLVIVDSPEINAFAVPGGIIGINLGTFLSAQNEGQVSSILAHELAHLSQRHHYRMKQEMKEQKISLYAGLLLSVTLAAAGSGEGAQAALAASQAAALHSQLRFSRQYEQEADRIGMDNLLASGYSKEDMIGMFETLKAQFAYSAINSRPPEYLLTHPLPDTRINEMRQLKLTESSQASASTLDFELLKTLVQVHYRARTGLNTTAMLKRIEKDKKRGDSISLQASHFGLAALYLKQGAAANALGILQGLIKQQPGQVIYHVQYIDTLLSLKRYAEALKHIQAYSQLRSVYAMQIAEVQSLNGLKQHQNAQQILFKLLQQYEKQPLVWYLLAETSGQQGDLIQQHEARAEYYIRLNRLEQAKEQLQYALADNSKLSSSRKASINNRLSWIENLKEEEKRLGF